jgi:23S rRNA pseudouridine1911/1915/1917 synthase
LEDIDLDELMEVEDEHELFEHFRFVVDKGTNTIRIDKYLVNCMSNTSRNRIQEAADAGNILVNGKPVKSNYKAKPFDIITIVLAYPPTEFEIIPQDIPLKIVYEDDDIMLVDKQPNLVVHPGFGNFDGTLLNAIAFHMKDHPDFDPNDSRIGLVHRIDKDTSGLLLIAKTEQAKTNLGKQFFEKTTQTKVSGISLGNCEGK